MTPDIRILMSILSLVLPVSAHTESTIEPTPSQLNVEAIKPVSLPATSHDLQQARRQMEELQFNMLELQTMLSRQDQNMILIKTKTSWIRKLLSNLHAWSLNHPTTENTDKLFNKFCWLVGDMEAEVNRDDMLDSIELQTLFTNYTQLENILSQIEHSLIKSAH